MSIMLIIRKTDALSNLTKTQDSLYTDASNKTKLGTSIENDVEIRAFEQSHSF